MDSAEVQLVLGVFLGRWSQYHIVEHQTNFIVGIGYDLAHEETSVATQHFVDLGLY